VDIKVNGSMPIQNSKMISMVKAEVPCSKKVILKIFSVLF